MLKNSGKVLRAVYPPELDIKEMVVHSMERDHPFAFRLDTTIKAPVFSHKDFKIKFLLPSNIAKYAGKFDIDFENLSTKEKISFINIDDDNGLLSVDLFDQNIDPELGFKLNFHGFTLTKFDKSFMLKLSFRDLEDSTDILESIEKEYKIVEYINEKSNVELSNYNLNEYSDYRIKYEIDELPVDNKTFDFVVKFHLAAQVDKHLLNVVRFNTDTEFDSFEVDEEDNKVIIKNVKPADLENIFLDLEIKKVKNKGITADNVFVEINMIQDGSIISSSEIYFDLHPITFKIIDSKLEEKDLNFTATIKFYYDKDLNGSNDLLLRISNELMIDDGAKCISSSDLPNFTELNQSCKFVKSDWDNLQKVFLIENLFYESMPNQIYEITFQGVSDSFVHAAQKLGIETVRKSNGDIIDNPLIRFVSRGEVNLNFHIPNNCKDYDLKTENCQSCIDGFEKQSEKCVLQL